MAAREGGSSICAPARLNANDLFGSATEPSPAALAEAFQLPRHAPREPAAQHGPPNVQQVARLVLRRADWAHEYWRPLGARFRPLKRPTNMPDDRREPGSPSWVSLVLRDVQFWVPVIVLAAGLLVLRWIA